MKIGLLFPSETEKNPILDYINVKEEKKICGLTFEKAEYLGHELIMVVSGIAKVNAAISSQLLIDYFKIDCLINTGVCGGLDHETKLFDLVISDKIYYHDVEKHFLTDEFPFLKEGYFESDPKLLEIASKVIAGNSSMKIGKTICGEQFITDQERDGLIERFKAVAVDMESGACAHVCHVNELPFIAIRSVTDDASHSGIQFFRDNVKKASKIAVDATMKLIELL